jgi:hypothetical protein
MRERAPSTTSKAEVTYRSPRRNVQLMAEAPKVLVCWNGCCTTRLALSFKVLSEAADDSASIVTRPAVKGGRRDTLDFMANS